jgi:hypothetical protein
MNNNFVLSIPNFLNKEECNSIIEKFNNFKKDDKFEYSSYYYCDITQNIFVDKFNKAIEQYKNTFKEITLTGSSWNLTNLRLKKFTSGNSFNQWHSEHCISNPYRVLNVQVYLTEHNCGTEFYNGEIIKSEIGKLTFFPAYFTHTHRGQVCPDNLDRYIITGYISFVKKGNLEQ